MDFTQYWQYTDWLTKTLFFVLILLSVASWTVGILRILASLKAKNGAADELAGYVGQYQEKLGTLAKPERKDFAEQLSLRSLAAKRVELENGLSLLGTTAAIAPFVGLFGTVWGIFHALHSISASGEAGLGQVAGPVGEALIMTALGLAVAIPAVIMYNIAVRANRRALHSMEDAAHAVVMRQLL